MNFLAHLFLSFGNEDLLIGNFIADFTKNKDLKNFSEEIQEGVMLHRAIDYYTDNHELVRKTVSRLHNNQGKYAPVVMDVIFDYLLAVNWENYSEISLKSFSEEIYKVFWRRIQEFPPRLQKILPLMIRNNFLESYSTIDGLRFALEKMNERTRFPSNFPLAIDILEDQFDEFELEFNSFFPDVIVFVKTNLQRQKIS